MRVVRPAHRQLAASRARGGLEAVSAMKPAREWALRGGGVLNILPLVKMTSINHLLMNAAVLGLIGVIVVVIRVAKLRLAAALSATRP
jgi:hypothetical protein